MNPEWRNRYELAIEAAHKAGQLALRYFNGEFAVEWKSDCSPVTVADREAEQLLRQTLLSAFPNDGFLGEESGDTPGSSGYRWIIDPIDGTRSFVRGIPLWATLVGLEYKGEQIAGISDAPALRYVHRALRGDGAYCDNRRIHVSDVADLSQALVFYSSVSWFLKAGKQDNFLELGRRAGRTRGLGDFYGFVLVAQGAGDAMIECGVHAWDVAAIKPIVEEAGGRFSNWQGEPTIHSSDVVISNGKLHDEILAILR